MKKIIIAPLSWSTASFGDTAQTSPAELSALGKHLHLCRGSHRRLVALRCAAASLHGFVATRFVTTLVIATLLIGAISLMV